MGVEMRTRKVVVKVALGVLAVLALAAAALGVMVVLSVWSTVAHGDEATQMKRAAEVLSCDPSRVKISGRRAEGCGRACLLEIAGSSATWWSSYACVPEAAATPAASAPASKP